MEAGKKRMSMGISWADEVEREEQQQIEEKRRGINDEGAKANNKSKPNPFGDARPREVVLEEKGFNWRILDQNFSGARREREKGISRRKLDPELEHNKHSILRKDKKLKENTKSLASPIVKESPMVPPLRYAPKNIMALMERIRRGRKDFSEAAVETSGIAKIKTSTWNENQQMHPHGRRQVLCDMNSNGKYCHEYRIHGANRRSSDVGVRRNPCLEAKKEGEDLRDTIRMKRRLSSSQNGSCNQRKK